MFRTNRVGAGSPHGVNNGYVNVDVLTMVNDIYIGAFFVVDLNNVHLSSVNMTKNDLL